jgi:hypothetical protein
MFRDHFRPDQHQPNEQVVTRMLCHCAAKLLCKGGDMDVCVIVDLQDHVGMRPGGMLNDRRGLVEDVMVACWCVNDQGVFES